VISPQTLISTLADVSSLKIDVPVPDRYANAVTVGTVLRCVKRSNLGTDTILATVYATEPTLEEATRTLRVRARLASGARAVPGTIVDVILQTAAASNALLVPTEAVQPGMKGSSVFVVNNGIAREVPVVLGGRTERRVHVLEGLRTGDTVATSGLLILKSGMPALATVSARQ
jgi:membrane fusion protein (multidrug efflux system)